MKTIQRYREEDREDYNHTMPVIGEIVCPDFDSNEKMINLVLFVLIPSLI